MASELTQLYDFLNNKRNFVGFTDFFDDLYNFDKNIKDSTFPPYNIYTDDITIYHQKGKNATCTTETHTFIQLACAGYTKERLKVEFNNKTCILTVSGSPATSVDTTNEEGGVKDKIWYYKGIADRSFKNSWKLSDKLEFVNCKFENGLLTLEFRNKDISKEDANHILPIN